MSVIVSSLTVLFEEPFWIGVFERSDEGNYEVCKVTFGAEPKDYEVYDFVMKNWKHLRFSQSVDDEKASENHINPKRMQRLINKQINTQGIGTKAQQTIKLMQEQMKTERKSRKKKQRDEEKQLQFEMKQIKRKQKHRGH